MRTVCLSALVALTMGLTSPAPAQSSSTELKGVAGLQSPIEILRDKGGVPHIRAKSEADALFGLGFVQAQDRLWQLEYMRRIGYGRLAEALGCPAPPNPATCAALQGDILFRMLGVADSGKKTWENYSNADKALIRSFVAGLNAATDRQRKTGLPPEFGILGISPDKWEPEHVMVIAKVTVWGVDQNWTQELLRAQLAQKVGPAAMLELTPAYAAGGPIIVPDAASVLSDKRSPLQKVPVPAFDGRVLARLGELHQNISERTGFGGQGIGSNGFALAPSRSKTGEAILAADPHLPSQIPSVFYRAHVTGGSLDSIGVTVVGAPGVTMGHNGKVAWGWTNANADVQDLYVETLSADGKTVLYNGVYEPVQFRMEPIVIKGIPTPIVVPVRTTRHGPLVTDLLGSVTPTQGLALRWAALDHDDDAGIRATLEANRANNRNQFLAAYGRHKVHPQNLTWADHSGKIGYLFAGTIPIRASGHNGTLPVPGHTPAFEWQGYVPANRLPSSENPRTGYVFSSNNQVAPATYPFTLGTSYAAPYRAMRLQELLNERARFGLRDVAAIQADVLATHARDILPLMRSVQPTDPNESQAVELLRKWDLEVTANSNAAAVFEAWYIQLADSIFKDELQEVYSSWTNQMHMVTMAMAAAVRNPSSPWCDNKATTGVTETCRQTAASALTLAMQRMTAAQGGESDPQKWQWGKAHSVIFFHQPFDAVPELKPKFSRTRPNGGDKHTLNVASSPVWNDYDQRHIALYRQIVDFADIDNSLWISAPGQSGRVDSRHYDDLIDEWLRVDYHPMSYSHKAVDSAVASKLELRP